MKEIIVSQKPTSPSTPNTAFLVMKGDGTHRRYVSDQNGVISENQDMVIKGANGVVVEKYGSDVTVKLSGEGVEVVGKNFDSYGFSI